MEFAEFLKKLKQIKGLTSLGQLYESLGGEEELEISLRRFQQIASGKTPPTLKLLGVIADHVSYRDMRPLVLAFFQSATREDSKNILGYLDKYLAPALAEEKKSLWDKDAPRVMYSEEQLDYLASNSDALRFHKKVLLYDGVPKSEVPHGVDLERLEELNLIAVKNDMVCSSAFLFRVPHYTNSSPKMVGKASDFIAAHLETFISREGGSNQELGYVMQMVEPHVAEEILKQMESFKRWIQSFASQETKPGEVPFIYVGFAKRLHEQEL